MAKAKVTTPYTIAEGDKYWEVFENDNIRTVFLSQADAEQWCTENNLEYTVV